MGGWRAPGLLRPLIAVLGGVAWGLCFGREAYVWAPWLALTPLLLLLGDRRAGRLGMLHGFAYWLTSVSWVAATLETFGRLQPWLAFLLLLGMALYLGAYTCAFAWLGRRLWLRGGAAALVGLPALWVALEWLRTYVWSGFPWNLAGYAWAEVAGALPLSAWVGAYGISFLVLSANTALARAIVTRRPAVWLAAVGGCLVVLAFGARWAGAPALADAAGGRGRPVRIIQPNTPNQTDWDPAASLESYERLLRLSTDACDVDGALVIWPESAAWPRDASDPRLRSDLAQLAGRGCTVVLNSAEQEGDRTFNSALLVDRTGVAGRYDKRHLVPYGEYVPLGDWLPFVGTVARMAGQFTAGSEPGLLSWGDEKLGMAICFEVIFPAEVAETVRAGATVLVTITNDAWYGDTFAPWQHFRAARFRAAEMRRPLARAAITGVSGVIAPDGEVVERLGVFEEGILRAELHGRSGISPVARRPWLVPLACSLVAAFAIFLVCARRGRETGRREGDPE